MAHSIYVMNYLCLLVAQQPGPLVILELSVYLLDLLPWKIAIHSKTRVISLYVSDCEAPPVVLHISGHREHFPLISECSSHVFSSISLHWSLRKAFLSLLAIVWNSIQMGISFLFSFAFSFSSFFSYLSGLLRQPFCLFAFIFLGDGLYHYLLYKVTDLQP